MFRALIARFPVGITAQSQWNFQGTLFRNPSRRGREEDIESLIGQLVGELVNDFVNRQHFGVGAQARIKMPPYSPRHDIVFMLIKYLAASLVQMSRNELSQRRRHTITQLHPLKIVHASSSVQDI